MKYVLFVTDV